MKSFAKLIVLLSLLVSQEAYAQVAYTWSGLLSTNYNNGLNWSPERAMPLPSDILIFNSGESVEISQVPSATIGGLKILNHTHVTISSTTTNKILTILPTPGNEIKIEPGSSLTFKNNGGVKIDVELNSDAAVEIGGTITMENGILDVNNGTLILHTNTEPLQSIAGQFSLGSTSTLIFGKDGEVPNGEIAIGDDIFVGSPAIGNLIINSINGVSLGNQAITITNQATFLSGNINTNSLGKLIFTESASIPNETRDSKVIGFAEMMPRTVGTGGFSFLGYTIAPGIDDLGNVTITKMTGTSGINFHDDNESIAVTWDVTVENQPVNGRDISMQWYSEFDNGNDVGLPMQMYRYTDGTAWEVVGGATMIDSDEDGLRTSATVLTDHFSQWTISSTDNALPVSLVSFEGEVINNNIQLAWVTASEVNNDRFVIQKMEAGEFVYVGTVQGNGTTSETKHYIFTDNNPSDGNNYYRLVQQDFDGQLTIHETITIEYKTGSSFEVYPNPSNGHELMVNMDNTPGEKASIKLYNAHGTLILEKMVASLSTDVLEGQELSRGLYYVEFNDNGNSEKRRVVVR